MSAGANKLQYALKTLKTHWEETKEGWTDQVRDNFEEKHLRPMETQVSATVRGMDQLAEVIAKVKQELS
ncbi:MAG TPA: hypothetical protein VGZ22_23545 [Isosphaeraceae bacterium]|jgi:hypothetical protein|nr:hypothetical protein [Isosphaeraceae bacterium]